MENLKCLDIHDPKVSLAQQKRLVLLFKENDPLIVSRQNEFAYNGVPIKVQEFSTNCS